MKVKADFSDLNRFLDEVGAFKKTVRNDLHFINYDILQEMKSRISKGLDMELRPMGTFSSVRLGNYSFRHGIERQKKGKQVGVKDMQFTGELFRDIGVHETSSIVSEGGISTSESLMKATDNEDYQEVIIFTPSDSEINSVIDEYLIKLLQ